MHFVINPKKCWCSADCFPRVCKKKMHRSEWMDQEFITTGDQRRFCNDL